MKINLSSFISGILFCFIFMIFSGGIFIPKHLKVNSIEILDEGPNSGYLIIKNIDENIVTYLGVGKNKRGLLTLKDKEGDTKINLSSNDDGGYLRTFNASNSEVIFLGSNSDKEGIFYNN